MSAKRTGESDEARSGDEDPLSGDGTSGERSAIRGGSGLKVDVSFAGVAAIPRRATSAERKDFESSDDLLESRKSRKRQTDLAYSRNRRRNIRVRFEELREHCGQLQTSNMNLYHEGKRLTKLLEQALALVKALEDPETKGAASAPAKMPPGIQTTMQPSIESYTRASLDSAFLASVPTLFANTSAPILGTVMQERHDLVVPRQGHSPHGNHFIQGGYDDPSHRAPASNTLSPINLQSFPDPKTQAILQQLIAQAFAVAPVEQPPAGAITRSLIPPPISPPLASATLSLLQSLASAPNSSSLQHASVIPQQLQQQAILSLLQPSQPATATTTTITAAATSPPLQAVLMQLLQQQQQRQQLASSVLFADGGSSHSSTTTSSSSSSSSHMNPNASLQEWLELLHRLGGVVRR